MVCVEKLSKRKQLNFPPGTPADVKNIFYKCFNFGNIKVEKKNFFIDVHKYLPLP